MFSRSSGTTAIKVPKNKVCIPETETEQGSGETQQLRALKDELCSTSIIPAEGKKTADSRSVSCVGNSQKNPELELVTEPETVALSPALWNLLSEPSHPNTLRCRLHFIWKKMLLPHILKRRVMRAEDQRAIPRFKTVCGPGVSLHVVFVRLLDAKQMQRPRVFRSYFSVSILNLLNTQIQDRTKSVFFFFRTAKYQTVPTFVGLRSRNYIYSFSCQQLHNHCCFDSNNCLFCPSGF